MNRLVKATELEVGNVLALPMGRTATVREIKPWSKRSQFLRFRTEHGWHRVEIFGEMLIEGPEEDTMRCGICQETVTLLEVEHGNVAEMYDPNVPANLESDVVHAECGLARGWKVS